MKTVKYLSLIIILAGVIGCSTPTFRPWMMDQVKPGMEKDQVTALLGTPDGVTQSENGEVLFYSYRMAVNTAFEDADMMNNNSQTDIIASRRMKKDLEPEQYVVNLKDGKVVSCEKVK